MAPQPRQKRRRSAPSKVSYAKIKRIQTSDDHLEDKELMENSPENKPIKSISGDGAKRRRGRQPGNKSSVESAVEGIGVKKGRGRQPARKGLVDVDLHEDGIDTVETSAKNKPIKHIPGAGGKKGRGRPPARKGLELIVFEKGKPLPKDKVQCPICLGIFVKPVTFECHHSVCFSCYKENIEKTSLCCPLCRLRVGVWSRKATKNDELVNVEFWNEIKSQYPDVIESQLEGRDISDFFEVEVHPRDGELVDSGQLLQECQSVLVVHTADLEKKRQEEEKLSVELIQKIQLEEQSASNRALENEQSDLEYAQSFRCEFGESTLQPVVQHQSDIQFTQCTPIEIPGLDEQINRLAALGDECGSGHEGGSGDGADLVFAEQQRRILERIEQEKADFKYAQQLQKAFKISSIDREEYQMRNRSKPPMETNVDYENNLDTGSSSSDPISTDSGRLLISTKKENPSLKSRKRKRVFNPKRSFESQTVFNNTIKRPKKIVRKAKRSTTNVSPQQTTPSTTIRNFFKPLPTATVTSPLEEPDVGESPRSQSLFDQMREPGGQLPYQPRRHDPDSDSDIDSTGANLEDMDLSLEELLADPDNDINELCQ